MSEKQSDLFGSVSTRPCANCRKPFIGVVVGGWCPTCEKNAAFYRQTRQRGEPSRFLDYAELLEQWRARRRECQMWRRGEERAAHDREDRERAEREKSWLLAALVALDGDPDLDLLAELGQARSEAQRLRAELEDWKGRARKAADEACALRLNELRSWRVEPTPAIPAEQWRRLVQLAHPDKHDGSSAATEAMKWLLEVRP